MKRQWGYDHIMTKKGVKRASADFGLIALAYNPSTKLRTGLNRIINIVGIKDLIEELRRLVLSLFKLFLELFLPVSNQISYLKQNFNTLVNKPKNHHFM